MFTFMQPPKTSEDPAAGLFELRFKNAAFDKFLTAAGIPQNADQGGMTNLTWDIGGLALFNRYKSSCIRAYVQNKELVQSLNSELKLEEFFDLETGEELPTADGEMSFETWLCEQGGSVELAGMAFLLLAAFGDHADFTAYFDYGGPEDWYQVFIKFPNEDAFTWYYL